MSGGKVFWLVWCGAWALFWITAGWLLPGFNLLMFFASVLAMIPSFVGNTPRQAALPDLQPCPMCGGGFVAPALAGHMATQHGQPQLPSQGRPLPR